MRGLSPSLCMAKQESRGTWGKGIFWKRHLSYISSVAQAVKCLPTVWETRVQSLGEEDLLEKEMATHSSILAWKIPWMKEPSRLLSMGSQRVGHNWAASLSLSFFSVKGRGSALSNIRLLPSHPKPKQVLFLKKKLCAAWLFLFTNFPPLIPASKQADPLSGQVLMGISKFYLALWIRNIKNKSSYNLLPEHISTHQIRSACSYKVAQTKVTGQVKTCFHSY